MKEPKILLLLPGLDGTGDLFADFVSALPPNLRAIIVSYPTDRFLTYNELSCCVAAAVPSHDPFVVVAESFSTPLAVGLAAHTNNLAGLVICAGFVTNPVEGWLRLIKPLIRPLTFRVRPPRFLIDYFLIGADAPATLRSEAIRTLRRVRADVIAARIRAVMACDARQQLAQVEVPTLYLQAAKDKLVKPRCGEEIQRIKPDTIFMSVAGPHFLLQRQPRETAEVIARFLCTL
jgi:pimeloyl-[acyl-carrier protein] methyl ester esterase